MLHGIVINGVIVLDGDEKLADGTRVDVSVAREGEKKPTLAERLLKHAGTVPLAQAAATSRTSE